jgi:hypothetical protein
LRRYDVTDFMRCDYWNTRFWIYKDTVYFNFNCNHRLFIFKEKKMTTHTEQKQRTGTFTPYMLGMLLVTIITIAIINAEIITYIGFAVFFAFGFTLGQSRGWRATRKIFRIFKQSSTEELEDD